MPYKHRKKKSPWLGRLKSLAITVAIIAPLAGAAYFFTFYEPTLSDQEYFANAQSSYEQGETKTAVIELKNAIKANPGFREARFLLGKIYLELGSGAAAEKELERASGFNTNPRELNRMLAKARLLQGKPRDAVDTLTSGTDSPEYLSYQENLIAGQAYFNLREWANANDVYNQALIQRPGSIAALVGLGKVAYSKGDIAIAKAYTEQFSEAAENNWEAWLLRGDIARSGKELQVAKHAYQKAIELKPDAVEPRLYHAMIALSEKKPDEAVEDANALIRVNSKQPAGHYIQGQVHFTNKEFKLARSSFEESIRHVDYPPSFRQLGFTHFQLNSLVQAEEYIKKYLTMAPRDLEAQKLLSAIYARQNKLEDAKNTLRSVASQATLNEPLQRMMAGLEQATGEPEKATNILSNLLTQNPESLETRLQLGQTLLRQRKPQQALEVLTEAAEKDPASSNAKLLIISAYVQLQQFPQAFSVSKELVDLDPENPRFASIDGAIYLISGDEQEAMNSFKGVQKAYPGDIFSGHQLGLMAIKEKQYDEATGYYETILTHHENHLQSQIQLGLIAYATKQPLKAQKLLEKAADTHPESPRPKLILARASLVNNEPKKALNWLQQIDENARQLPSYLLTLGQAYLLDQQPAKATDTLVKLNKIQPTIDHYWLEAKARFLQQDIQGARVVLLKAQDLEPNNARISNALFELLLAETEIAIQQKDSETVEKNLLVIKRHEDPLPYLYLMGHFEASKENYDKAATYYQKVQDLRPGVKTLSLLLSTLGRSGQNALAEQYAEQWLQEHPDDQQIALQLAGMQLADERTESAIKNYEQMLKTEPNNVIALNNLAFLYVESDPDTAIKYAERAYKLAPDAAAIVDTYGWINLARGENLKALSALRKAHSLDPAEPSIQYHLASALAKNNKELDAIQLLRDLSDKQFPEKEEANKLLSSLEWKPE